MPGVISPIGAKSILAMGTQSAFGLPVQASQVVESTSGGLEGTMAKLYSQANHDSPSPRSKASLGSFSGGGGFAAEVTARRAIPRLLSNLFGPPTETILSPTTLAQATTVIAGGAVGAGATRSYYIVARTAAGVGSLPSPVKTITTIATLSGINSVAISWVDNNTQAGVTVASYDILCYVGASPTVTQALQIGTVVYPTATFTDTGTVGITGNPTGAYTTVPVPVSTKTWTHTWARGFSTFIQKKGNEVMAFPDCAVSAFSLKAERTQGAVIGSQWKAEAGDMAPFADAGTSSGGLSTAMSLTGLTTAMYDSSSAFSPSYGILSVINVGGTLVTAANMEGFGLNFDRKTADEYAFTGQAGPVGFRDSVSALDITTTAKLIGGSEADLKTFMGKASTTSSEAAYGFDFNIQEVTMQMLFFYPSGYGFDNQFVILVPRACYGALGQAVGGRDQPIKQEIRVEPIYDGTSGTDLIISITSAETMASIIAADATLTMPTSIVQTPAP